MNPQDTSTHQDHVIAHVLGSTVLGYFIFDEALYILLDIGFVWTILLDGEMGLLPHPVAISELEIDEIAKGEIKADIDLLLREGASSENLLRLQAAPERCQITDVNFFASGENRRLIIAGEGSSLAVDTSLASKEVHVMTLDDAEKEVAEDSSSASDLEAVAQDEHQYVHQRLREDLGREPTEAEVDEWLREHTEGY